MREMGYKVNRDDDNGDGATNTGYLIRRRGGPRKGYVLNSRE